MLSPNRKTQTLGNVTHTPEEPSDLKIMFNVEDNERFLSINFQFLSAEMKLLNVINNYIQ